VLNSSDVPGGVVNILTGERKELLSHFSSHMDVNALVYYGTNPLEIKSIEEGASSNVKRVYAHKKQNSHEEKAQGPYHILDTLEIKTTWHPIENIGAAKSGY
jgi:hypothetical protein